MQNPNVFLIVGGLALVLCIVLACFYRNLKRQLDEMWAVDTYDARELRRMVKGGFDATVEVQGTVTCDNPLTSLATGIPCCWFHTTVEREVEEVRTETETDSEGRTHTRTVIEHEWRTAFDQSFSTILKVHDQTGHTLVDPTKADIDAEEVYHEVVHGRESWFDESIWHSDTGRYRIREEVFAPRGFAYVLGQASDHDGEALIHYPDRGYLDPKKKFFIISRKSEQELTRSKQTGVTLCFWFAIVALLLAGACVVAYFRAGGLFAGRVA